MRKTYTLDRAWFADTECEAPQSGAFGKTLRRTLTRIFAKLW